MEDILNNIRPFREDDKQTIQAISMCLSALYSMVEDQAEKESIKYSIRLMSDRLQYWLAWNQEYIIRLNKANEKRTPETAPLRSFNDMGTDVRKLSSIYVRNVNWEDAFQLIIDDAVLIINNDRDKPELSFQENKDIALRIAQVAHNLRSSLKTSIKSTKIKRKAR